MRYEGNTLCEALGKALGTRDQYGRKIVRGQPLTRKQVDTTSTHATARAIGMSRIQAVRLARTEIASKTVAAGEDETGIIIAYNRKTGDLVQAEGQIQIDQECFDLYNDPERTQDWSCLPIALPVLLNDTVLEAAD